MNNKLISHSLSTLRIIAISSLTIFTLYTVQAWVSPTVSAPNGNVGGPLTTATTTQVKSGSLGLLDSLSIGKDLIVNGTFRLPTGAASGTVLMSDANGNASWQVATGASGGSFGPGYAWQDMIASRAMGTVYTNTTGNPIVVMLVIQNATGFKVNGITVPEWSSIVGGIMYSYVNAIVPNGSTYQAIGGAIAGGIGGGQWLELRCDSGVNCSSGGGGFSVAPGTLGGYCAETNGSTPVFPATSCYNNPSTCEGGTGRRMINGCASGWTLTNTACHPLCLKS